MVARSEVEALEAEVTKLRKDLIIAMVDANTAKTKAKALASGLKVEKQLTVQKDEQLQATNQKVKSMAAKAVQAFQLTEEYNTILFNWYYKGFELLRWYMVKHPSGVNLDELDFKEVDKEMEADEVTQAAATLEENTLKGNDPKPEDSPIDVAGGDEATTWNTFSFIWSCYFSLFCGGA